MSVGAYRGTLVPRYLVYGSGFVQDTMIPSQAYIQRAASQFCAEDDHGEYALHARAESQFLVGPSNGH